MIRECILISYPPMIWYSQLGDNTYCKARPQDHRGTGQEQDYILESDRLSHPGVREDPNLMSLQNGNLSQVGALKALHVQTSSQLQTWRCRSS